MYIIFTYICNFAFFRLPTDNLKLTPEQMSVVNYDEDNGVIKIMAFAGNFKKFVIFVCVYVLLWEIEYHNIIASFE